jgi:hypothetical protein
VGTTSVLTHLSGRKFSASGFLLDERHLYAPTSDLANIAPQRGQTLTNGEST